MKSTKQVHKLKVCFFFISSFIYKKKKKKKKAYFQTHSKKYGSATAKKEFFKLGLIYLRGTCITLSLSLFYTCSFVEQILVIGVIAGSAGGWFS
jgi:hypothetical protein